MKVVNISEEHKIKFSKLKSIHSKLKFWEDELKIPYYFFHQLEHMSIQDVLIDCHNEDEIETLNTLMLAQFEEKDERKAIPILFNLYKMKDSFKEEASKARNLTLLKNIELGNIEEKLEKFISSQTSIVQNVKEFCSASYYGFIHDNTAPDYSSRVFELPHLVALENGYRLAQYYIYVESFKADSFNAGLELKDKILLLKYLGLLDQIDKIEDLSMNMKGRLLSSLLEENQSNIEKAYRSIYIQDKHSEKNIARVVSFLDSLKLHELANKLREEENFID